MIIEKVERWVVCVCLEWHEELKVLYLKMFMGLSFIEKKEEEKKRE